MSKKSVKHVVPTTEAQAAFKIKLRIAKAILSVAQSRYDNLLKSCAHSIAYSYKKPTAKEAKWGVQGSVWCELCGHKWHHLCLESPDKTCHYFTEDGRIKLVTGELIAVPNAEHNPQYETEDSCLFCHLPNDRG